MRVASPVSAIVIEATHLSPTRDPPPFVWTERAPSLKNARDRPTIRHVCGDFFRGQERLGAPTPAPSALGGEFVDQPRVPDAVTALLIEWSGGNQAALDRLLPLVYDELHRMAAARLGRERPDHTLQPTALVHEAYLRLVDQKSADWRNRAQFFGIAATMMRRILVNHARDRAAQKRGGGGERVSLSAAVEWGGEPELDLIGLDDALSRLATLDARKGQIVDLKFFAGLNTEEIAEVLHVSASTVERDWRFARAWLYDALSAA